MQNVGTHTHSVSPFIFLKKRRTYRDFFKTYRKNLENERNEHYTRTRYTTHKRLGGFAPYTMKNDIHVETHRFIKETFVLCRVVPFWLCHEIVLHEKTATNQYHRASTTGVKTGVNTETKRDPRPHSPMFLMFTTRDCIAVPIGCHQ